jgi:arylsulfatase A
MSRVLSRRGFLRATAPLPLAALAQAQRPPVNIVFLLVDDMGWSDLACYGSDFHETPNIDRLARESVRFINAYSASPVCSPTRASIMTGKNPARLNMTIWREGSMRSVTGRKLIPPRTESDLPHSEYTLAEALHDAGYFNAHIGKWHLGGPNHYPEAQGFDVNIGGTHWGAPQDFFWPYTGAKHHGGEFRYVPGLPYGKPGEYLTDRLTDESLNIVSRVKDRPFFLNFWYHTVHTPIQGKPELVERYRRKLKPDLKHKNATYAAMVHSLDQSVGRVLKRLDDSGLSQNTAVILTSDNGGYINQYAGETVTNNHPLRSGKGSLYEGGIRVPLLIRWPGVTTAGAACDALVCTTDFYPTILELLGRPGRAAQNAAMDGVSLAPLLRDPKAKLDRDTLHFHYPHYYPTTTPVSAIRVRNWKLLHYYEDSRDELYDLAADPSESRDLAPSSAAKARELRARLFEWLTSVRAQFPRPNTRPEQAHEAACRRPVALS